MRSDDGTVDSGISAEVWEAANLLEDFTSLPFADIYGGKEFGTADLDTIVVFLTERNREIEDDVAHYLAVPDEKIEFRDAATSWAQLTEVSERVMADFGILKEKYSANGAGISSELTVVLYSSRSLDDTEKQELRRIYGDTLTFEVDTAVFQTADGRKSGDE